MKFGERDRNPPDSQTSVLGPRLQDLQAEGGFKTPFPTSSPDISEPCPHWFGLPDRLLIPNPCPLWNHRTYVALPTADAMPDADVDVARMPAPYRLSVPKLDLI